MLLTHNLSTVELGSINWRQVINQNFVYLDNNRIFVVDLDSDLPSSNFKANRFFYSKETKSLHFDNGTILSKLSGGAEIDLANNANKFIKVNATGTALEYTTLTSLSNEATGTDSLSIGAITTSSRLVNIGKTTSGIYRSFATETINIGTNSSTDFQGAISIGYNAKSIQSSSATGQICIGYNTRSLITGVNGGFGTTIVGSESFIAKNDSGTTNSSNSNNTTIFGRYNRIIGDGNIKNIVFGADNAINGNNKIGNILFGNGIYSTLTKSIIFAKTTGAIGMYDNHASICYSTMPNAKNQKQILEVARTKINTTDLTTTQRYYQDSSTGNIKILNNTFFNMKYTINIFKQLGYQGLDATNNQIKTIKGEILGYCATDIVVIKKHTKEVFYEDTEYSLADIDFVSSSTSTREIFFKINTNGILSNISGEIEIKYNTTEDFSSSSAH